MSIITIMDRNWKLYEKLMEEVELKKKFYIERDLKLNPVTVSNMESKNKKKSS